MGDLFTRDDGVRIVASGDLRLVKRFFKSRQEPLHEALLSRFSRYTHVVYKENPDNVGLYLLDPRFHVPFFWFGIAWNAARGPDATPQWGCSMEVIGEPLEAFFDDAGGLLGAWQAAAHDTAEIRINQFATHVELAAWRPFEWLLPAKDHGRELISFWEEYLDALVAHDVEGATAAFHEALT